MSSSPKTVNSASGPTAPLRNVQIFTELTERLLHRPLHLPGLGVFYGFSGYGKTHAAAFAANRYGAYYLEAGASWNVTTLIDNIYHELTGYGMKGSISKKVNEIISILASDSRPLIIDEADHLVKHSMIDHIREISDRTLAPLILIGEESLPAKLAAYERTSNRILEFRAAEPCNVEDAQSLATLYVPHLKLDEGLLRHLVDASDGVTRRICINLERVSELARREGLTEITMAKWGEKVSIYSGRVEPRRKAAGRMA